MTSTTRMLRQPRSRRRSRTSTRWRSGFRDPTTTSIADLARSTATSWCSAPAARWGRRSRAWPSAPRPRRRIIAVARFSDASAEESLRGARRRDGAGRPARPQPRRERCRGARTSSSWPVRSSAPPDAPSRTWAMNTVLPGARRRSHAGEPDRRVLDRLRLPVRAGRVRRRDRGLAADAAGRVREQLRRPRAHAAAGTRRRTARRAASSGSTTRSTCATACCTTSRRKVRDGEPVDVTTGHVNVIWQGDANAMALRCLRPLHDPDRAAERHRPGDDLGPRARARFRRAVRQAADDRRARRRRPRGSATQAAPSRCFGYPKVSLATMIDWVADWLARDMPTLSKPTQLRGAGWLLLRRGARARAARRASSDGRPRRLCAVRGGRLEPDRGGLVAADPARAGVRHPGPGRPSRRDRSRGAVSVGVRLGRAWSSSTSPIGGAGSRHA